MAKRRPPAAPKSRASLGWRAVALGVAALALAGAVAAYLSLAPPQAPPPSRRDGELARAGLRLAARSPTEDEVADACESIRPLLGKMDCAEFLSERWEQAPWLSRPGAQWARQLMGISDMRRMIGSWPMRFLKNHGTANMQKPGSGFLIDERWQRGDEVPVDAVDVAIREQRTLVMHNLEVYWPPVGELVRQVVRYFHAYSQVNVYMSPAELSVATTAHQDAHSVFILQLHGAKRWCVHPPPSPFTHKSLQRGKRGEIIASDDRAAMGAPLLNVTLTPGRVLYIPRAYFHHTSTDPAQLAAKDELSPAVAAAGDGGDGDGGDGGGWEGQPSMALTFSILSEDVFSTWLHLLGEAAQELPKMNLALAVAAADNMGRNALAAEAEVLVGALRRAANSDSRSVFAPSEEGGGERFPGQTDWEALETLGARLREALPRALVGSCGGGAAAAGAAPKVFSDSSWANREWRKHASWLMRYAIKTDAEAGATWRAKPGGLPAWLIPVLPESMQVDAAIFVALDAVLHRKRISCRGKLAQIEAMRDALDGRLPLTGEPVQGVDVDAIFAIEKSDKTWLPQDRSWHNARQW